MDIEITFINQSDDENNSQVVIFQQNVGAPAQLKSQNTTALQKDMNTSETAVAWTVIKNCGRNWSHKFKYPINFSVAVQDPFGNVSDLKPAQNGQKWKIERLPSGDALVLDPEGASSQNEIDIENGLSEGNSIAQIYKDGRLLALKTISPQQKATFGFNTTIRVGVVSEIEEGAIMNSAILSSLNTEISLLGITKANLIMTGGGSGKSARPFSFTFVPTA